MVYVIPHLVEFFRATHTPGFVQVFFVGLILIFFCNSARRGLSPSGPAFPTVKSATYAVSLNVHFARIKYNSHK